MGQRFLSKKTRVTVCFSVAALETIFVLAALFSVFTIIVTVLSQLKIFVEVAAETLVTNCVDKSVVKIKHSEKNHLNVFSSVFLLSCWGQHSRKRYCAAYGLFQRYCGQLPEHPTHRS